MNNKYANAIEEFLAQFPSPGLVQVLTGLET